MLEQQRFLQQQQHNAAAQAQEHYNANGNNAQNQIGGPAWGGPFPSLHLWPLNETFVLKMIHLPEGQKVGFWLEAITRVTELLISTDQDWKADQRQDGTGGEERIL